MSKASDGRRLQVDGVAEGPLCASVEARLRDAGALTDEHWVGEWALLVSKAGCQRQHRHANYDPAALRGKRVAPLILLVGLQGGSRLHVEDEVLTFGRGDVVVMCGDAVHAGAAYRKHNARLHAYADVAGVTRAPDEGMRQIFAAKVTLGRSVDYGSDIPKRRPAWNDDGFHSRTGTEKDVRFLKRSIDKLKSRGEWRDDHPLKRMVDNGAEHGRQYVVHRASQAYPAYVVMYTNPNFSEGKIPW